MSSKIDKLEFEYPADFLDSKEVQAPPELPPFRASSILYVVSGLFLFSGVMLPLAEIMSRPRDNMPDTFIELLEWNPYSQLGLIVIAHALFLFWLGLMTDRRGA